jgi:ketosteroid isomerase-like protein
LYERYAELLPDGPARAQATATARAVATVPGPMSLDRYAAIIGPDVEFVDHRPVGLPPSLLALDDRRSLSVVRWEGSEAEGPFEIPAVDVTEYGPDGIRLREDIYGLDQLDQAWARYAALRPDPLRIPPNAATRAGDRWAECGQARDWAALATLLAPTLVFEDRRRLLRTAGDRDMAIASTREIASQGARPSRTLLATAGDRLSLERIRFLGGDGGSAFEVDTLHLVEVDAEGLVVAILVFDPDDRRAASAELRERYARGDAARCIPVAVFDAFRAFNDHDLSRFGATLHDAFVFHDHRRTGVGTLERGTYLASVRPLFEGAPDVSSEDLYCIATEQHGYLAIGRDSGTLREGGEFESIYARIVLYRDGRIVGMEQFEPEHVHLARARFEALRARASSSVSSGADAAGGEPRG